MVAARILVVEDAPEFAQLITAALRGDHHEVTSAGTLSDARERLRSTPPDVVVLDFEPAKERVFAEWAMASVGEDDVELDLESAGPEGSIDTDNLLLTGEYIFDLLQAQTAELRQHQ